MRKVDILGLKNIKEAINSKTEEQKLKSRYAELNTKLVDWGMCRQFRYDKLSTKDKQLYENLTKRVIHYLETNCLKVISAKSKGVKPKTTGGKNAITKM